MKINAFILILEIIIKLFFYKINIKLTNIKLKKVNCYKYTNQVETNLNFFGRCTVYNHLTKNCNNLDSKKTNTTKEKKALSHNALTEYRNLSNYLKSTLCLKKFNRNIYIRKIVEFLSCYWYINYIIIVIL